MVRKINSGDNNIGHKLYLPFHPPLYDIQLKNILQYILDRTIYLTCSLVIIVSKCSEEKVYTRFEINLDGQRETV